MSEEKKTGAAAPAEEKKPAAKRAKKAAPAEAVKDAAAPAAAKKTAAKKTTAKAEKDAAVPAEEKKPAAKRTKKAAPAEAGKDAAAPTAAKKTAAKKTTAKAEKDAAVPAEEKKPAAKRTKKAAPAETAKDAGAPTAEKKPAAKRTKRAAPAEEAAVTAAPAADLPQPRRSVAFIGSECYPFVKTGGLGDVMYALPRALSRLNCDVKVILPKYRCIPWEYQEKMVYRGSFMMDLCEDGRSFFVAVMEYVWDGVVYDFIDNEEFFGYGNPYTDLYNDIPRFCFFAKAALSALNYMDWVPDVIHCHDWQAALVPAYLKTRFGGTPVGGAKTIMTIHNLRFQGRCGIPHMRYWTGLPDYVFNEDALMHGYQEANMLKGGIAYADMVTTVSATYADEIQTQFFGEGLDGHLRYHAGKLRGIVNGIDCDIWNSRTDALLAAPYDASDVLEKKRANKLALQEQLGLERDDGKFVIGLVSRLTDQKGLDLVNAIVPEMVDGNTQLVVLGTGDPWYESAFRGYEEAYKGSVCANIMYDEGRAHRIYAGADALLVPSLFEPCGLTQLIAMRYGTIPVVRQTGGLKDTVDFYHWERNEGNGFCFDRYDPALLLDAVNQAKTLFFTKRSLWDEMVMRDMAKDVSWENSARQYRALYLELRP